MADFAGGFVEPAHVMAVPANSSRLVLTVAASTLIALLLLALATVILCGGHFVYCLDDPYITLALSRNIAAGHYGLNAAEAASPSSSILYPFVLAAFAWATWQEWVPLMVNSASAAATAALFAVICAHYRIGVRPEQQSRAALLVVAVAFSINIIGVVFTGLEHSLHTLTSVAVVYGLALTLEDGVVPVWLIPAVVLNPLWRFEGIALSVLTLLALACSGHVRAAIIGFAVGAGLLTAYMLLMAFLGLPLLPSSVIVKADVLAPAAPGWLIVPQLLKRALVGAFYNSPRLILLWVSVAIVAVRPFLKARAMRDHHPLSRWHEILLAAVVVGAVAAHALFGHWGGWFRYEVYVLAVGVAGMVILWHVEIERFLQRATPRSVGLAALTILLLGVFYLRGTILAPFGGRSIYEQQYQMHRFAVDYYRQPVAVNDLGWVSYRNTQYVLDLWGLGSEAARKARMVTHAAGWMDELATKHSVGLAMIYPDWFTKEIPDTWRPIAVLHPAHHSFTPAEHEVVFYATSPGAQSDALTALHRFAAATSPSVATVTFW